MWKQIKKYRIIFVILVIVFVLSYNSSPLKVTDRERKPLPVPQFISPSFGILAVNDTSSAIDAWAVFQDYRNFARNHNLEGIRNISYQISTTCNDPLKEKECFNLMDNVYDITRNFEFNQFKNILQDKKQIVMYTDGPTVAIIYFTREEGARPKVLALSICPEDANSVGSCVNPDFIKRDQNGNGWWDGVESLFH